MSTGPLPTTSLKFIDIANAYNASGLGNVGIANLKLSDFAGAVLTDGTVPSSGPFNTSMFYGKTFQLPNPEFSSPSFTSTINLANTADVGYTLDKDIASGTIEFLDVSGIVSSHTVNLSGSELDQGTFLGELTNPPTLVVGTTYKLTFNGTDSDGNVATPVTLTGTMPFGQFGDGTTGSTNYKIGKRVSGPGVKSLNPETNDLFDQMRAAYLIKGEVLGTVKLHVVNGAPHSVDPSGTDPVSLDDHIEDSTDLHNDGFNTFAGGTIEEKGYTNIGNAPNYIGFFNYFRAGQGYNYNELHNATFLITIT
jgi:hypothetical protein